MGVTSILGDQAIGAYLYGSLAHGGFDAYSDIDVVVATEADPTNPQLEALQVMHNHLAARDSNWSIQLEVSYLDRKALRRYDPTRSLHPKLNRGRHERLERVVHDSDWVVVRHTLRDLAWVLFGAHPDSLIEPVSPTDLRQAMHALFRSWVATIPDQPASLQQRGGQSWTVLTLCRMLYTLECGTPSLQARGGAVGARGFGGRMGAADRRDLGGSPATAVDDVPSGPEADPGVCLVRPRTQQSRGRVNTSGHSSALGRRQSTSRSSRPPKVRRCMLRPSGLNVGPGHRAHRQW